MGRGSGRRAAVAIAIAIGLVACGGGDDASSGDDGSSGEQVSIVDRIESSEDCDELATIRADQQALAEEQDGTSAHTGFAIAARARMTAIGCEVEE